MDTDSVKDEIKRRVRIEDLVAQHVVLQRAGSRLRARCPFHQEKTPSFYVNPELGLYKCFGCGVSGDVFEFLMKIEGLTFTEAAERLAERVGLRWRVQPGEEARAGRRQLLRRANDLAVEFFHAELHSLAGREALAYLQGRQFGEEIISRFRLGYAADSWDALLRHLRGKGIDESVAAEVGLARAREGGGHYDVFRHRVMFPISDVSGRVLGFGGRALSAEDPAKYLNTPETDIFKKGRNVYALGLARAAVLRERAVVVVEGYTDVLALHQAGIENVVACLGTALTQDHLNLLARHAEEIILAYDADAAGMSAAARNIPMLEACSSEVKIALMPSGLDPDECIKREGPEEFRRLLANRTTPVEYELELTFARHGAEGPEGLARAAREAVDVLLRVKDRSRRDEFLARAADRWGGLALAPAVGSAGKTGRTEAMQRVLRDELQRRLSERKAPASVRPESPRDQGYVSRALAAMAEGIPPGIVTAERELLTVALGGHEHARRVLGMLAPEELSGPEHAALAAAIQAQLQAPEPYTAAAVLERLQDPAARELGVELAFQDTPALEEEVLGANLAKVKAYRLAGGHLPRHEVSPDPEQAAPAPEEDFEALRSYVVAQMNAGEARDDDPRITKYREIMRRMHGSGNRSLL